MSYIYFTRIIVFLLGSSLTWEHAYWATVATQSGEQARRQPVYTTFSSAFVVPQHLDSWAKQLRKLNPSRTAFTICSNVRVLRCDWLQVSTDVC